MRSYIDFTADGCHLKPDGIAIVSDEGTLTFSELDNRAEQFATSLRRTGIKVGERVAWLGANEKEFAELQSGCLKGGFALVPLNPRLSFEELRLLANNCEPAVLVQGRSELPKAARLSESIAPNLVLTLGAGESYEAFIGETTPDPEANPTDPDLLATVIYTSGTTGVAKGAMIDRRCLSSRLLATAIETRATGNDIFFCALPMFHIAAYMAYAFLMRGGRLVQRSSAFDSRAVLDTISRHQVTVLLAVPTMLSRLVDTMAQPGFDSPPIRLRQINYGASSMPPTLLEQAMRTFGCDFQQQYGLTESQMLTVLQAEDHVPDDAGALASVGRPAVSATVRIVDTTGAPLPSGDTGEVVSQGPSIMSGYWQDPDATSEAFRDGWFHTGDVGRFDERGRLHVVARLDDVIVSGGEKVYPEEIERVLAEISEVGQVIVIGLAHADLGQQVTAVVQNGAPPDQVLEGYLRGRIADYKIPRRWLHLPSLPTSSTGKVLRRVLIQQLERPPCSPEADEA